MDSVYEMIFFLKHHGHWSLNEIYSIPIKLREWFVKRLMKYHEDQKEANQIND